jgi:lipopolysaccharide transport system ATP-binding protein
MTDVAIRVENLSKQYRIGGPQARYKTIRESLTEAVQAPFRRLSSVVRGQSSTVSNETIWALKDVSFEVQRGEVVGIPSLRQAQYKRQAQGRHWPQRGGEDHAA